PDVAPRLERDAFLAHQRQSAIEPPLLELEFWNAVPQQAADPIRALEDRDQVAGAIQLRGRGETCRPRSHDGNALTRAARWRLSDDPALGECALDDGVF